MKKTYFFTFLIAGLFIVSCNSNTTSEAADETESTPKVEEAPITIGQFDKPAKAFDGAMLKGYTYQKSEFIFEVADDAGEYELGAQTDDAASRMCANSGKGQHIHLIVDQNPYVAKYENAFQYDFEEEGEHYMLAFLSRSYHESIKTGKAHIAEKITISNGAVNAKETIEDPMLFYSRPKGTYVGDDAKRIMVDFFLVNTDLAPEGNKVKMEIDGIDQGNLESWKPHYIEGLSMGEHTITLSLIDGEGNLIDAPLNPVERTIILQEATPEG